MALKNAVVQSDYDVDNDGPFHEATAGEVVGVPTLHLTAYTVATAPVGTEEGELAYFSDGDAGAPCLAVWTTIGEATAWFRIALGAAIAAE